MVFVGDLLEMGVVGGQLGDLDVHRGTDSGAQVGGAESQESEAIVVGEGHLGFDLGDSRYQSAVDLWKKSVIEKKNSRQELKKKREVPNILD